MVVYEDDTLYRVLHPGQHLNINPYPISQNYGNKYVSMQLLTTHKAKPFNIHLKLKTFL